jgi:ribonuclease III
VNRPPSELADQLGLSFSDPALLERALTHRSAPGRTHNERLEFLGDAVLGLVIASELCQRHPELEEGDLTRMRAHLVRAETLAAVGQEIDLGSFLALGQGERKSGGQRRGSTQADAVEALVGAAYVDQGFDQARALVLRLYEDRLADLPEPGTLKDPKTRLQEYLQGRGMARPDYNQLSTSGDDHAPSFRVRCEVPDLSLSAEGEGSSRRRAEQRSAAALLEALTDV